MDGLFRFATARGLLVNIGDRAASLRVPIEAASQPLTIAWLNPPGTAGWMGLTSLTLGCDSSSTMNRLGEVPDVLTDSVEQARMLPRATAVSKSHLEGYRLPPETIIGEMDYITRLISDAAAGLNAE